MGKTEAAGVKRRGAVDGLRGDKGKDIAGGVREM